MTDAKPVSRFTRNPFFSADLPTLADVLTRLEHNAALDGARGRDMRSAVRRLAALLGRAPQMLPASLPVLTAALETTHPATAGLSAKTLQNMRSNVAAALRYLGITAAPHTARSRLAPAWADLHAALPDRRLKTGLSRFARYCSAMGIAPDAVSDAVVAGFVIAVREGTFVHKPNMLHRQVTRLWNEAGETVSGWPATRLGVPDFRKSRVSLPLASFPVAFQRDVAKHLDWLAGSDPFCEHPPPKPCKPRTINLRRKQIELAASAYVTSGGSASDLQTLADLVRVDTVRQVLRHYIAKNDGAITQFTRDLALALIERERARLSGKRRPRPPRPSRT